jgi:hypothetical protein
MLNAPVNIPEPQAKKKPNTLSSAVLVQEAQNVIRKAFPYEGDLRVRHLWSADGFSRFRANWFREEDGETRIVKSLFFCATRVEDGLVVQNDTAVR